MSSTQNPPAPADARTVGSRANALIASIKQAGTKASEADRATQALTPDNVAHNPTLDDCIMGIVLAIISSTSSMTGPPPAFTAVEQNEIYNAFKDFVQGFRQFIKSMVDKHEVMAPNPGKGNALAGFLLACKLCVDKFAINVISMLPVRVDDAQLQLGSFDSSLNEAVDAFRS